MKHDLKKKKPTFKKKQTKKNKKSIQNRSNDVAETVRSFHFWNF